VHDLGTFPLMSRRLLRCFPATVALLGGLAAVACSKENPKLMVTGIDPDKGDTEGESYVHIKGNRFTVDGPRTAKVFFGGRPGRVISFPSDGDMVVQPPGGKPNEVVDVLIVFDPGGTLKIPNGFRFVEKTHGMPSVDDLGSNHKN
jgi:hypothetical protein